VNKNSYVEALPRLLDLLFDFFQSFSSVIFDRDILLCFLGTLQISGKNRLLTLSCLSLWNISTPTGWIVVNFILGDLN
jgi:uncharacterized membrane protein YgdD (TMEM256/DUF423 family)